MNNEMAVKQKYDPTEERNLWAKYEQRKAELPEDLSPAEYHAACQRIADELGI